MKMLYEYWLTITLSTIALSVFLLEQTFAFDASSFEFRVSEPAQVQIFGLMSCHFLHWSTQHLFWDVGVFVVLCIIGERVSRTATATVLATSSVLIPLAVSFFQLDIETYRGLSGLDTALFGWVVTWFAVDSWKKSDHTATLFCAVLLIAMCGKTIHEYSSGTIFVSDTSFVPVPIAHVIGGIVGVGVAMFQRLAAHRGTKAQRR